jgi:hypothetical protein
VVLVWSIVPQRGLWDRLEPLGIWEWLDPQGTTRSEARAAAEMEQIEAGLVDPRIHLLTGLALPALRSLYFS